ncbi:MAG TPA: hypothetical protein VHQ47_09410 [Phycisphaerae bacterium]|nr:hypothetical protein [Phycisphaerae bacterium]
MNTATSWHVGRAAGRCASCKSELPPGTACWATLCEIAPASISAAPSPRHEHGPKKAGAGGEPEGAGPAPFVRIDFCEKCWGEGKRPASLGAAEGVDGVGAPGEMFSFWKTVVPAAQQKKKLLVDDSVLMDVFTRMEGKTEPQEIRFRFVLALILMRKRLLKYEGMEERGEGGEGRGLAPETWIMAPRGSGPPGQAVHVINPHLTEEQIAEVSQQLSAILAEEL